MKKIITTICLSFMLCTAFSQKYNQISFYSLHTKRADLITDKDLKGTVDIDMKDSVLTINDGATKTFKISAFAPEQSVLSEDHVLTTWVAFLCVAKDGVTYCTVRLTRQKHPDHTNIMQLEANYDDNNVQTYICNYLKDLY